MRRSTVQRKKWKAAQIKKKGGHKTNVVVWLCASLVSIEKKDRRIFGFNFNIKTCLWENKNLFLKAQCFKMSKNVYQK